MFLKCWLVVCRPLCGQMLAVLCFKLFFGVRDTVGMDYNGSYDLCVGTMICLSLSLWWIKFYLRPLVYS